jgi:hypothetical protein
VVAGSLSPVPLTLKVEHQYNHRFLIAVRYAFNVARPGSASAAHARGRGGPFLSSIFDRDKATLTDRARQIIRAAADNSTHVQYTRINVNGYTDTSGTPQYNMGVSVRRVKAVQAEQIKDGVRANAISIHFVFRTVAVEPKPGRFRFSARIGNFSGGGAIMAYSLPGRVRGGNLICDLSSAQSRGRT